MAERKVQGKRARTKSALVDATQFVTDEFMEEGELGKDGEI